MSALQIVIARLGAVSGVTAIVGSRIYPVEAPQGVDQTYIVVSLIGETDDQMLAGSGGYYHSRVQVMSVAPSDGPNRAAAANSLGEAVKAALGDVVKASIAGKTGVDIWKAGADHSAYSDDRKAYWRNTDFYVRWKS